MFFPISNTHISPIYLAVVGFLIGILGGFFGVGGSFIAGPALRLMGVDWNYAVGTDLAHIVGKSIVAARQHRSLGNVDLKLGFFMAFGTIGGAECGAQLIQALKRAGNVNMVVSWVSIVVYFSIAVFMLWESQKNTEIRKEGTPEAVCGKRRTIKRRSLSVPPHHAVYSTAEDLANDRATHVRCKNFTLDYSSGCFCRWVLQRFSRWWRRLHSNAVDGLRAGNTYTSRCGNRSF